MSHDVMEDNGGSGKMCRQREEKRGPDSGLRMIAGDPRWRHLAHISCERTWKISEDQGVIHQNQTVVGPKAC